MGDITPSVPTRAASFGRYRLVSLIGSGGMAAVYRAVLPGPAGFERAVVIKRLLPQFSDDPLHARMMANEAKLVSQLQHPNIVQLFEFGEAEGEYYLAMELVEGVDLTGVLRGLAAAGERLPVDLACLIGLRLAEALGYAHRLGVIHRDLSPSNVMLTRAGQVKLLDFGIARGVGPGHEKTQTGVLKGKLTYMAPEQLEGVPSDGRSDLFALGVVLHEVLTGRRLFRAEGELAVLRLRRELVVVPPVSASRDDVPETVSEVVTAMLAWNPAERPAHGEEVAERLRPFAGSEGPLATLVKRVVPERPEAPLTVSMGPRASPSVDANSVAVSRPAAAPRRWPAVAVALLAGGALTALGGWYRAQAVEAPARIPPPPGVKAVTAPPSQPATVPLAEEAQAEIVLRLRGPAGAKVTIDGLERGGLPLQVRLPKRAADVKVMVSRRGYEPYAATVAGDVDSTVDVVLRRRSRPAAPDPPSHQEISDPFR